MKKRTAIWIGLCVACAVTSASAATVATKISAELRPDFKIIIDGQERVFRDADGDVVYPVLYNGTTYLPIRAIGGIMGKDVSWDGSTSTVELKNPAAQTPAAGAATITEAEARAIAVQRAGLADSGELVCRIRLDRDDGRLVYEVELMTKNADGFVDSEYEAEIDAATGDILKWEQERA